MKTKTITLTTDQWERIRDAAEMHSDRGPEGEGWQSEELTAARDALASALDAAVEKEG
ncbi:MAG: hypothetical protein V4819_11260 [Verrucomicrobiota bacterium]